ncbi:MAG: hypothetical protein ABI629_26640 [bacterium]
MYRFGTNGGWAGWIGAARHLTSRALTLAACAMLVSPAVCAAATCDATRLAASGLLAKRLLACHAAAAKHGAEVTTICLDTATTKFGFKFDSASGDCSTTGLIGSTVQALVTSQVDTAVAALRPALDANTCASSKLQSTGVAVRSGLSCIGRSAKKGIPTDPCLVKQEAALTAKYATLEVKKAPCLTTLDATVVSGIANHLTDSVAITLGLGGGFSSTATPTDTKTSTPTPTPTATPTSTAAIGCNAGNFPACNGSCPVGFVCIALFSTCSCAPF